MKKEQKPKKRLLTNSHQLLSIKEVMETVLLEADGLPVEVKQAVVTARDSAWKAFISEQEKVNSTVR